MEILSIIATISVFGANMIIRKYQRLAFVLFIICNICYVIMMFSIDKILMVQNLGLAMIGLWNLISCKKEQRDGE
jgi:hypothetical protein